MWWQRAGASHGSTLPPANPFVRGPAAAGAAVLEAEEPEGELVEPGLEERHLLGGEDSVRGPLEPPGPLRAGPPARWRLLEHPEPATHQVVGLHRASGSSTVGELLHLCDERWACPADNAADVGTATILVGEARPLVLAIAQLSPRGLRAAAEAALEWGSVAQVSDRAMLVGLALVSDGRSTARITLSDARKVMRMYPRSWHLPWVPDWYMRGQADPGEAPRRHRQVAAGITRWSDRLAQISQEEA